ncbi:DNA topoisomerase 3 [Entomobacter blattae]|uniref:DNA topoisomerase n=1 Tax=Entomobacter blattae TaxID=2762277 RepID=A0A7H1NP79_9PROT|nr:DNA topoisomerase 3 [Entomobacter blattae]QNT77589.1 DNA topoisomerase 3 [Entomobacter blattae]
MTTLYIAEKPSVARVLADELGKEVQKEGYIQCKNNVLITWCFGHLLEQEEPDAYLPETVPVGRNGRKLWRKIDLPIIPTTWKLKPRKDAFKQFKIIRDLLKQVKIVVHAGDPDREGQLLVDEVLEYCRFKGVIKRYWASAQDKASVRKALSHLEDNQDFIGWGHAALARSRADWLIGMNCTRAYTLSARDQGVNQLLVAGRVQTPTLSLVVNRDKEREYFRAKAYYTLAGLFYCPDEAGQVTARWKPRDGQEGCDEEGRLIDKALADRLCKALSGQSGCLTSLTEEDKKQACPKGLSGADIAILASKRWGYTAQQTLDATQSLYEKKLITYPRTDSSFLPQSQFGEAGEVLECVGKNNPDEVLWKEANPALKSRIWNDQKVTAHHAIIPTRHKGSMPALKPEERNIYRAICQNYVAQFFPDHLYKLKTALFDVEGEQFVATGRTVTQMGWKVLYQGQQNGDEEEQGKPEGKDKGSEGSENEGAVFPVSLREGMVVLCYKVTSEAKQTNPPEAFTEGSLIQAMINIQKYVSDIKQKAMLKETDGIGTAATRAAIIEELVRKGYLERKKKTLISTGVGRLVIACLEGVLTEPAITALFERRLKEIQDGKEGEARFLTSIYDLINKEMEKAFSKSFTESQASVSDRKKAGQSQTGKNLSAATNEVSYSCPDCNKPLVKREAKSSTKKNPRYWWGCSGFPSCKAMYFDKDNKPEFVSK